MKSFSTIILLFISLNTFAANTYKNVDILFVIDNSGSMEPIQQNIIKNVNSVMKQLAQSPYLNWKIGVISTDKSDNPYLGFETPFDWSIIEYRDPNSINVAMNIFKDALSQLGTGGDASEYVFYNVNRVLEMYPQFLRPDANLAVVMVSDEDEQSASDFGDNFKATPFLLSLYEKVTRKSNIRFYGALSRVDLEECNRTGDSSPYQGSTYEEIIKLTRGFAISACAKNFGDELVRITKDISNL